MPLNPSIVTDFWFQWHCNDTDSLCHLCWFAMSFSQPVSCFAALYCLCINNLGKWHHIFVSSIVTHLSIHLCSMLLNFCVFKGTGFTMPSCMILWNSQCIYNCTWYYVECIGTVCEKSKIWKKVGLILVLFQKTVYNSIYKMLIQ